MPRDTYSHSVFDDDPELSPEERQSIHQSLANRASRAGKVYSELGEPDLPVDDISPQQTRLFDLEETDDFDDCDD